MRKFTYLTHKDKKQKKWKTQKSIKHTLNPSFPFSLFFVLFKKSRKKNQEKNHGAAPRGALFALRSFAAFSAVPWPLWVFSPQATLLREKTIYSCIHTYIY